MLSSFTVHPDMPSEPGVGWQFLMATLEHADNVGARVVLVTSRRSEIACRGRLPSDFASILDVVAVDIPFSPPFFRWHYPRFTRIEHEIWVRLAARHVQDIERRYNVLYAHHVTFATEILSTPITRMSPATFKVWGPIGAGGVAEVFAVEPAPKAARRQRLLQRLRDSVARVPATRVARRCDLVLAQNSALERVLAGSSTPSRIFPNVVVDMSPSDLHRPSRPYVSVLMVGHLIARKRHELTIDAMAADALRDAVLDIVGFDDTDHATYLRGLARRLGVEDRVVFHGSAARETVLGMMQQADVLVHPSGREGASGVVGEAATCGLPVVCFAGTGASSVLEHSGTSGVVLIPGPTTDRKTIADAIVRAAGMPRVRTDLWTSQRFVDLAAQLHDEALKFRARHSGVL